MIGALGVALISLASVGSGLWMLLRPDPWVDFFRVARTETGRKVNRHLISRTSVRMQGAALLLGGVVFAVIAVALFLS